MATEDILINDGDSFVSLSALAAEQVEAELPISDNRDPVTVKLDSPSANTFAVSTGGVERVKVNNDLANFNVPIQEIDGTAASPIYTFQDNPNTGLYRPGTGQLGVATGGVNRATFANTLATFATSVKVESSTFSPLNIVSSSENAFVKIDAKDSSWWNGVVGETYQIQGKPGASAVSIITVSSDGSVDLPYGLRQLTCLNVIAEGQVQTSSVSGLAANDASIALGTGFVVNVGSIQRIIASESSLTLDFPIIDIKQTGSENGADLYFGGSAKDVSDFARFGKIQGRLSSDAVASGAYEGELCFWSQIGNAPYYRTAPDIQIKADGSVAFNNGNIQTSSVSGLNANEASIELGANLTVSTGGEERLKVEDTKTTVSGQIRNLTDSSTVAYLESTTASAAVKLNSTDHDWWVGPNNFGFCIYDDSSDQKKFVFDSAGNFIVNNGQVQTDKITSKSGASNDASIELGATVTVQAGGKNQIQSNGINCIKTLQVGSASAPALAFSDTTTGFFFAPDEGGQYDTNNSGVAFTIANANSGVSARELLRLQRNGQLVSWDGYTPAQPNSIATKQTVDDKIWVGTTAEYISIDPADIKPTTLYCITD